VADGFAVTAGLQFDQLQATRSAHTTFRRVGRKGSALTSADGTETSAQGASAPDHDVLVFATLRAVVGLDGLFNLELTLAVPMA